MGLVATGGLPRRRGAPCGAEVCESELAVSEQQHQNLPEMVLPQHGLTRYLRIRLEVEDGVLRWQRPRTVLGVLPLSSRRFGVPLELVRSLRLRQPTLRPARLTVGLLLVGMPFFVLPWWAALPLMVAGIWVSLVSLGPRLEIDTRSGRRHRAAVCFGHRFDADLFIDAVSGMIDPPEVRGTPRSSDRFPKRPDNEET